MILHDAPQPSAPRASFPLLEGDEAIDVEGFGGLIADSPAMRSLLRELERLEEAPLVLLQGETGTGKDFLARFLHHRATGGVPPFLELDPSALDAEQLAVELEGPSRWEGGRTLLIREIAELAVEPQRRLLEALDSIAEAGGRIVCSTQRDLEHEVGRGSFLPVLWDRLQPVTLRLPPLRERWQDLPSLIHHFLDELSDLYDRTRVELTGEAWQILRNHRWDGNVRELRNEIERLVVFAPEEGPVGVAGLSAALQPESHGRSTTPTGRLRRRRGTVFRGRRCQGRGCQSRRRQGRRWSLRAAAGRFPGARPGAWPGRARRRPRR